jgi:hypothetical protein
MENTACSETPSLLARWRELAWPREHGSWSLALEPIALGLLVAPSRGGAWLALAVIAGFFARRPLRTAARDPKPERRTAAREPLAACAIVALGAFGAAMAAGGTGWLIWLAPVAIAGAVFLFFDLRGGGREEIAEVAGVMAFAGVPAMLAALAGWGMASALALALVMAGRSVPTVLCVRAVLRGQKGGGRRRAPALLAAWLAVGAGVALAVAGLAPDAAVVLLGVLAVRATILLGWSGSPLRARTIGIIEAVLGGVFVFGAAFAWRG